MNLRNIFYETPAGNSLFRPRLIGQAVFNLSFCVSVMETALLIKVTDADLSALLSCNRAGLGDVRHRGRVFLDSF